MTKRPSPSPRPPGARAETPNYWDYIRVEELLTLQTGLAESEDELENDEVLFITVHQVFELWFKLILHETDKVDRDFSANDLYGVPAVHRST